VQVVSDHNRYVFASIFAFLFLLDNWPGFSWFYLSLSLFSTLFDSNRARFRRMTDMFLILWSCKARPLEMSNSFVSFSRNFVVCRFFFFRAGIALLSWIRQSITYKRSWFELWFRRIFVSTKPNSSCLFRFALFVSSSVFLFNSAFWCSVFTITQSIGTSYCLWVWLTLVARFRFRPNRSSFGLTVFSYHTTFNIRCLDSSLFRLRLSFVFICRRDFRLTHFLATFAVL
jgi:hypothetical protein